MKSPKTCLFMALFVAPNSFVFAQTFTKITAGAIVNDGGSSQGCAWGDYDNDGDLDLVVMNEFGGNFLYQNNGDGTFTPITTVPIVTDRGSSYACSWGDYDNDGDLDLFVANDGNNFLYRNNGDHSFTKIATGAIVNDGGPSYGCAWGDYDKDGDLDLFVANFFGQKNFLYRNDGPVGFAKITSGAIVNDGGNSTGCAWADYDNDGDLDLFVTNYGENNFLYENNGDRTFTRFTSGAIVTDVGISEGCSWGDYDNDGDLDLFVTNYGGNNFLYQNNGNRTFTKITAGPMVNDGERSIGSSWGDYDNDGDLDLFVANEGPNSLYRNDDPQRTLFTKITVGEIVTDTGLSRGAVWGDYNNDGALDLFVANSGINNLLYQNDGNSYNWINISLVGTFSNASAIGARVSVKSTINGAPVWQLREISAQTGAFSQNSLNAEFGLGNAAIIDSIKVAWPSGIVQTLTNVAPNRMLTITEPQFTRATSSVVATDRGNSYGGSWADYDNDGDLDLFVTNSGGENNFLYRNDWPTGFAKIDTGKIVNDGGNSFGSTWGDYDNDGDLDLFVANGSNQNNFLNRNDGPAGFAKIDTGKIVTDGGSSFGCAWGDYDNDGHLDLFVANIGNNFLYRNNGNGGFAKITTGRIVTDGGNSQGCSWGDYDNDGDLDLFVANAGGENNFLYRNDGAAGFFKITTGAIVNSGGNSFGASWGDYDNDGDLDLFVSNDGGNNFLYENNGNGSFTRINTGAIVEDGSRSFGSSWGDYDNDGDLDLFVAKLGDDALYRNNGGDSFTKVTAGEIVQAGRLTYGAIWGDYDNDGDLDLFAANILGEDNFLYQNVGTRNHWLNIQLNGTVSNAAAIGAKVSILATIDRSLVRQARELSGQTGYLSQNSLNAEFGLGDAAMADSLRVDWPSGAVNRYANIVADQFLRLQENNRPRIANAIADVTLSSAAPDFVRDLNAAPVVFVDPESDALTYSAASSDTSIVKARLSLSTLTMNLVSETALGQAKITVTADDGKVDDGRGNTEVMTIAVNRRPFVVNQIPNQTIVLRDTSDRLVVADLRNVFLDPDGDAPAYTASSSNGAVAIAIITGSTLSISPRDSSGETTIRVTADDRRGGTAALEFTVKNVLVNTSPRLAGNPIPDQVLIVSGRRFARELNPVFIDDENNDLTYSASSSNLAAAIASISFDTLIVIPRDIGIAVITVRANDGLGGEASTTFKVEVLRSFRPVIFHAPITSRNTDQAVAIEADITDDEGALANATLSYRIAGNANFETIQMERSAINDTTFHVIASIPAIAVTNRGVEYFIAAADTHAVPSRLPASGIFSIRVRVEGQGVRKAGAQPAADEQTGYRLISIPLDLDAKQPGAVLEDDLGAYDPAQWRLFQWVPLATGGVAKVEFPNTSAISPGAALWLIVKSADQFIDSGPGTTVSTAEKFPIPLNRGWNLVGNPFNFPTVAEDTLSDGDPLHIFSYNGVWSGRLDASATQLQPFEGYAVFSSSTAAMLVKPNPFDPESSSPYLIIMNVRSDAFRRSIFVKSLTPEGATTNVHFRSNLRKQTASFNEEASWSIRILAQCQKAKDENNVAAVARDAAREYDRLDHPEPPGIGEYVSVYFPHPEWQRLSKSYCTDFRPEPPEGDEWEFEIKTNIRDVVNLTFAGVESVPLAYDVCLVDKALKITSNLRQRDNYAVAGSGENHPKRLTLVVGKSSYLNEKLAEFRLVPTTYELSQNFPNPFNPATTIRYALPNPERVTLRVYDMLGKVVVTLVDHELKEAGYHAAVWNGRNTAGNLAASSIYFVRMQVGNFVQVRKMVLIE